MHYSANISYSHNVFLHYALGPACQGSTSLYVPPLNYKREGTQRYKGHAQLHSIQFTHSGGRVLRFGSLNHYNPSSPLVFIRNSPSTRQAKRLGPPPHLRIRAGAFCHPARGFSMRQLFLPSYVYEKRCNCDLLI
jgi:hypothetical protein